MNFLSQLGGELRKLFGRQRTYLGYIVFLVMEAIILLVFKLPGSQRTMRTLIETNGFGFDEYYSSLTVTYWVMGFSMFLLGSIYFALVAGDIVAKESEDGNLRLVLARPVSRLRILLLKYAAVSIYTVSFVIFVGVTGYLMSVIALGFDGGLFVWNYKMKVFSAFATWGDGMGRIAMAALGIGISMITLSSIAFMFSCFKMKPAAATIVALSILFVDLVLQEFPFFRPYEQYFVTWRMSNWVYLLENTISWPKIAGSYAFLFGLNATLFLIGFTAFRLRDFKT
ncbi:ABC transporter permease [Luteolibacter sp. GHJ8]|uniref:ABC transporter permease n=1 Tax=Luteolibacter rhizosphaerae TaxID=2989719 RepID=A0ABT3G4I1_9BACT|nr:ABC transporter permease [Luteolibacter rhizosphaerae]MCW1914737.1 ABC transporter permease [Luteolibacter rhizosphaerae]